MQITRTLTFLPRCEYSKLFFIHFFDILKFSRLLAHAMVEENEGFLDEIFHWALPHCAYDRFLVRQLESLKFLMFQAMGYKGAVSRFCLENVVMF